MDTKVLISQVRALQAKYWQGSDLWEETQRRLAEIADHLEQCPECRAAFDAQEYPEATLIDFEPRVANTPISDWICAVPTIDLSPLDYEDEGPLALLEQAYNREGPRQVLLVVEWEEHRISAETRDLSTEGTPEIRWHGRESAYDLDPLVDATRLRRWVADEVLPLARPLFAAYNTEWNGDDWVGDFHGYEQAKQDFDAWMYRHAEEAPRLAGENAGIWAPEEWLVDPPEGLRATSTDEEIAEIAAEIVLEARAEDVLISGDLLARLRGMRDGMRDAAGPDPDTYQIQGYEVLERVAKPFGNGAYLQIPKCDLGKRFKAVRVDP